MRFSIRAKLGLRAAEALALALVAACGGGSQNGSPAPVVQDEAGVVEGGVTPSADAGASCAVGCSDSDAATTADSGRPGADAGAFDGDPTAIFVAPTGSDSAPGTMSKPVLTIGKGVLLAQGAHKDLYVCDGTYTENVIIDTKPVNVHGGYDCTKGWARVDDKPTIAPQAGVPLIVRGVPTTMTVERLQLQAADASTEGASSIAAIASSSSDVAFSKVVFQAGAGASGAQGTFPQPNTTGARSGVPGSSVGGQLCPQGDKSGTCGQIAFGGFVFGVPAGCNTVGGSGGNGANLEIGYVGTKPSSGSGGAGQDPDGNGLDGLNGGNGKNGATATSALGTFTATGYVASNAGTSGEDGQPGASGGGGVAGGSDYANIQGFYGCPYIYIGAGGGEGGWGGCGGSAGGGGGGGGASVGLLAFQSTVSVAGCQVNTSAGGDGGSPGKGAFGQLGGPGGGAGMGNYGGGNNAACFNSGPLGNGRNGGMGGRGGSGGNGGAGGGGPSIGIVVVGAQQPDTSSVDFNIGTGGQGGQSFSGPNAPGGQSTQVLGLGAGDGGAAAADAAMDQ
jgi:hypothetical protein